MRFLRMLTNALLAGALGAAYLTILVLQLNPHVPLFTATPWRWFLTIGLLYGVHLAVAVYVVIVAREFFTMSVFSPAWISVRLLAWAAAILAALGGTLMWLNAQGLAATLDQGAEWRMTAGAVATLASAVMLLAIAVAHYSFGRRGSRVGASLFVIAVIGSLALPLAARGPGAPPEPPPPHRQPLAAEHDTAAPRVTLLMLDGASLEYLWLRAADGRLPAFSRILDGGAVMDLATIRPTQPGPVWAAVATGMYPAANGIRSAARYYAGRDAHGIDLLPDHMLSHALVHLGFVRDEPRSARNWGAAPLWSILSGVGMSSGVVRWPITHPAPPVAGFMVSDQLHQFTGSLTEFGNAAYPADALSMVQPLLDVDAGGEEPVPFSPNTPEATALQRDALYGRIGRVLKERVGPRLFALRYEGLDVVGHHYLLLPRERTPGREGDEARRRKTEAVERYYAFVDAELGRFVQAMIPGDLLLVVSAFGMERTPTLKRALAWVFGEPVFSGTHDRAPDGFLLAFGNTVRPGRPPRGAIVDIAPTILYFFGLPVARDMDGYARVDLFTQEFAAERPVTFIPSYR